MQFASIYRDGKEQLSIRKGNQILVLKESWAREQDFPYTMEELVTRGFDGIEHAVRFQEELLQTDSVAGEWVDETSVQFAPSVCRGRKIICVGLNYLKHVNESRLELPKSPLLFSKFDNTLAAHGEAVARPETTEKLDYEAEVAVVIGKQARNVSETDAFNYVLGYTLANDLSARDLQFATSQWLLGKSCDGFCPIGPALVTKDEVPDINNIRLRCIVNGEVRQDASTAQMMFSFATLIHYISSHFTLEPGDVILSGTPEGVILGMPEGQQNWLRAGDEVIVEAEHLGRLKTTIA